MNLSLAAYHSWIFLLEKQNCEKNIMSDDEDHLYKILVVGEFGVGKYTFCSQFSCLDTPHGLLGDRYYLFNTSLLLFTTFLP